jgi:hypothetical protein
METPLGLRAYLLALGLVGLLNATQATLGIRHRGVLGVPMILKHRTPAITATAI